MARRNDNKVTETSSTSTAVVGTEIVSTKTVTPRSARQAIVKMTSTNDDSSSNSPSKTTTIRRSTTSTRRNQPRPSSVWKISIVLLFQLVTIFHSVQYPLVVDAANDENEDGTGGGVGGESILDGRFYTTSDVTKYLALAYDAAQLDETEEITEKLELYKYVS